MQALGEHGVVASIQIIEALACDCENLAGHSLEELMVAQVLSRHYLLTDKGLRV